MYVSSLERTDLFSSYRQWISKEMIGKAVFKLLVACCHFLLCYLHVLCLYTRLSKRQAQVVFHGVITCNLILIIKTRLFKYIENFTSKKGKIFK